jgi:hypothetical protein
MGQYRLNIIAETMVFPISLYHLAVKSEYYPSLNMSLIRGTPLAEALAFTRRRRIAVLKN